MTKCKDITKIMLKVNSNKLKPPKRYKEILGFDTETFTETKITDIEDINKAFLITCSNGEFNLINNFDDVITFLTHHKFRKTLNFFFNLRFDFQALIKWLYPDYKKVYYEIWLYGKSTYKNYTIKYINNKFFSITDKNKDVYSFFDLAQFYLGYDLERASKKYLGKEKLKIVDVNKFDEKYIKKNLDKIILYSIRDSQLCKDLAEYRFNTMRKLNIPSERPFSIAKISERYFRTYIEFPIILHKPILQYALNSYNGGWFEVFEKGHFDNVYLYDINSAYPYEIANLIDVSNKNGYWEFKKNDYNDNAYYVFAECIINQNVLQKSPIPIEYKLGNFKLKINPQGIFKTTLTKNELKFLEKNDIESDILNSWNFYPADTTPIFRNLIHNLYEEKERAKKEGDECAYWIFKSLGNSLYGKLIQLSKIQNERYSYKSGNIFNPVYASIITANTRLKIAQVIKEYENDVISVATDSIMSYKKILNDSDELGAWKLEDYGECIVLGSGVYSIKGQKKDIHKFRGVKKGIDLFDVLKENKNKRIIRLKVKRAIQLGNALREDRLNELNRFVREDRKININFDIKRKWLKNFTNCGEVLNKSISSKPINVNEKDAIISYQLLTRKEINPCFEEDLNEIKLRLKDYLDFKDKKMTVECIA